MLLSSTVLTYLRSAIYSRSEIWWHKSSSIDNPAVAKIINRAERPLVVARLTNGDGRSIISLSYSLDPEVRLQLLHSPSKIPKISTDYESVFLYSLSDQFKEEIRRQTNADTNIVFQNWNRSVEKLIK